MIPTTTLTCAHCREQVSFVAEALRFLRRTKRLAPFICRECREACACRGGLGAPCVECQSASVIRQLEETQSAIKSGALRLPSNT